MMLHYYAKLGWQQLRRQPLLTGLMVLTLAIGVAASVSTLTILHVLANNPAAHKSARLLVPVLDNGTLQNPTPRAPGEGPQLTYRDAQNLLKLNLPARKAALFGVRGVLETPQRTQSALEYDGAALAGDYFALFDIPFLYGAAWRATDEAGAARVLVLSRKLSETLFGARNPVGQKLLLLQHEFVIVGVLDHWQPMPRYTHLINGNGGPFNGEDQLYMPMPTAVQLEMPGSGLMWCARVAKPGYQGRLESECTWLQFWLEIDQVEQRTQVLHALQAYAHSQADRLAQRVPVALYDVGQWLTLLRVVKSDSKLAVWLAFGFLLLCLVNTVCLLLAKFSTRAAEIGVRRALGASQREIFRQFLSETLIIGLAGCLLGLPLCYAMLSLMARSLAGVDNLPPVNGFLLASSLVISLAASLVAGLWPTWRACQVAPAWQLKSQ
jgi:putative ABC transport system permease protein